MNAEVGFFTSNSNDHNCDGGDGDGDKTSWMHEGKVENVNKVEDVFGASCFDMDVWGMKSDHPDQQTVLEQQRHKITRSVPMKRDVNEISSLMLQEDIDVGDQFTSSSAAASTHPPVRVRRTRSSERHKHTKKDSRTSSRSGGSSKRRTTKSGDRKKLRSKCTDYDDDDADNDDDDDGIGVPVVGEFVLKVENCDPFAHNDLKLREPKAKRADRFRKEKIDTLMNSIKKEQYQRRSCSRLRQPSSKQIDNDRLNENDNQKWENFDKSTVHNHFITAQLSSRCNIGHRQVLSDEQVQSEVSHFSSPRSTCMDFVDHPSVQTKVKGLKQKNQPHGNSYLSNRVKERVLSGKDPSKDRRSSVNDSLTQFLESKNRVSVDKKQDPIPSPIRRYNSLANRSFSSAPGLGRPRTRKMRSRRRSSSNSGKSRLEVTKMAVAHFVLHAVHNRR